MRVLLIFVIMVGSFCMAACSAGNRKSEDTVLRVVLIPADGGTADGTLADYAPLFHDIGEMTQTEFTLAVGSSYNSVVDAMCSGAADLAFLGPVTYVQAEKRGCAEFLASGVVSGEAVYYSGLFVREDSGIKQVADVKGRSAAFGDVNSTTSFVFPLTIMMDHGVDPVEDLSSVRITGTHTNSIAALVQGQVDVAGASFESFEKAVRQGAADPANLRVLARSEPIPYPPLAMNTHLAEETKQMLREAFSRVHIGRENGTSTLRGYGGKAVERYETDLSPDAFGVVATAMRRVDDKIKAAILRKAGER